MNGTSNNLAGQLARMTREGDLYERLAEGKVRCHACGHRCLIPPGRAGVCRVRFNRDGKLFVPWGYVAALQCDPIEKKPFFHALPGTLAMSFGMLGCDLHCGYCQNWLSSQALRDPASGTATRRLDPPALAEVALRQGAATVTSTYNEPLITSEWAVELFRHARQRGLRTAFVSNGNGTPEVLDYLQPWVDFYKVDLKSFQDRHYRHLGGTLASVLRTIEQLVARGFWVEVVTLVVPGFNDQETELRQIARFLAGVSRDIPWHCTAFHPDYRMLQTGCTPAASLVRACEIGVAEGVRYCYAGNATGRVGHWEATRCHQCGQILVERTGFQVSRYELTAAGSCPKCGTAIPGRWF